MHTHNRVTSAEMLAEGFADLRDIAGSAKQRDIAGWMPADQVRDYLARGWNDPEVGVDGYHAAREARSRMDAAAAKRRARNEGVAFWPAFIDLRCDAQAIRVANRVLEAVHGVRGSVAMDGTVSRGGWDSYGHHGLAGGDVAKMWFAAGCRDTTKFRAQVATRTLAKKGDSLPFVRNLARGQRWVRKNARHLCLSRKAVAALGRLTAQARWAAIAGLRAADGTVLRIRHLNWAAVRTVTQARAAGNTRVVASYLGKRGGDTLLGVMDDAGYVAAVCPAYPNINRGLANRIVRGESPAIASDGKLTGKEAHQWLMAGGGDIEVWLATHLGVPAHRDVKVIRWLAAVRAAGRWATMEKVRTTFIGGERRPFTALDVLDEIQDIDILTGKDAVGDVLNRVSARRSEEYAQQHEGDHTVLASLPGWCATLPRWVRPLRTPAALVKEGREMHHCAGTYSQVVRSQKGVVLSFISRGRRSTIEMSHDGTSCRQIKAYGNGVAPRLHQAWLNAWLKSRKESEGWGRTG